MQVTQGDIEVFPMSSVYCGFGVIGEEFSFEFSCSMCADRKD